jgi:hypothetical protein
MKTGAAVFAATMLVVSCYGALRLDHVVGLRIRALVWSFTAVAVIGITWATRGVILSGYPLFPSQFLGMTVDWRVPAEHARAEFDFVVHSARATAGNFAFVSGTAEGLGVWLLHWGRNAFENPYNLVVPTGLAAMGILFLLLSYGRTHSVDRASTRSGWLMLAPLGIALAAWFAVAPMPHYGAPFFWSVAALIGSQAFGLRPRNDVLTRRVVAAGCLLGLTPCVIAPAWSSLQSGSPGNVVRDILDTNIKLSDPGRWYQSGELKPQLSTYTTRSGLVLNVPIGPFGRCWDAPLPCTPNPAPNLRLRDPGHIDKGFRVDGGWQMLDWPEPWRPELLPALRDGWRKRDGSASAK